MEQSREEQIAKLVSNYRAAVEKADVAREYLRRAFALMEECCALGCPVEALNTEGEPVRLPLRFVFRGADAGESVTPACLDWD